MSIFLFANLLYTNRIRSSKTWMMLTVMLMKSRNQVTTYVQIDWLILINYKNSSRRDVGRDYWEDELLSLWFASHSSTAK